MSGQRDEHAKRDLRARGLRQRRERIALFTEEQRIRRDWINFDELAGRCAHRGDPLKPDEADRSGAYDLLLRAVRVGDFEEGGESQVLFLTPAFSVPRTTAEVPLQARRMTRERLRAAVETPASQMDPSGIIRYQYLAHCWVPRRMAELWLKQHGLQSLIPFFAPQREKHVRAIQRTETAAAQALAEHLRRNEHATRENAKAWLKKQGLELTQRGFMHRVWPAGRKLAGLSPTAPAGAKPKSVR